MLKSFLKPFRLPSACRPCGASCYAGSTSWAALFRRAFFDSLCVRTYRTCRGVSAGLVVGKSIVQEFIGTVNIFSKNFFEEAKKVSQTVLEKQKARKKRATKNPTAVLGETPANAGDRPAHPTAVPGETPANAGDRPAHPTAVPGETQANAGERWRPARPQPLSSPCLSSPCLSSPSPTLPEEIETSLRSVSLSGPDGPDAQSERSYFSFCASIESP